MGQLFSDTATHEPVPAEVQQRIEPITYTPAPLSERRQDDRVCEGCGEPYMWYFTPSTNCDWCGRQLCRRCCPNRYLLGGNPGCPDCTRKAFVMKRDAMLKEHLAFKKAHNQPVEVDVT
ncbi:hypothetical protein LSM04_002407 [Trypanosoma melophagium]|uniref:uncharacterized protein n=1 Tax=Trypanosoma melophagium TaxID=715481 RepID=UPI00351A8384|nr:hypothetical protein LSM04_002407 [Trypanosoma melophagium]